MIDGVGSSVLHRGCCLSKSDSSRLVSRQQSTRVYEKNNLQPGYTLQFFVQISRRSVNSSVRARTRHMVALEYQLNCPRYMHEPYIHVRTNGKLLGVKACIF